LNDRFLPDKAIDLIDEAGAMMKLHAASDHQEVGVREIEEVLSKIAHIPAKNISISDKDTIKNLAQNLKMLVFGQDKAIEALVSSIKLARTGLREPSKPWGCFMFAGPTGVGKTEVTQQLANLLHVKLLRFDMSEYMEAHTVARLIGAPPGYVGYDQGGLLTEGVIKHPYSIVLLDEIEKAHQDLFNILLQVMDNGSLTDTNGRTADFRNTIIIMTTNAGAFESSKNSIGFIEQDNSFNGMEALKRVFSPEFRNRLDAVIQFSPLGTEIVHFIVEKFLDQLQGQLTEKGIVMEVSEPAKVWLGKKGYDAKMGARSMARLIQEQVKKPLAEEILFGQLSQGGIVKIDLEGETLAFAYQARITESIEDDVKVE
jgi:ATP-dependent Clp protease ATP-binding subunit ClpA